MNRSDAKILVTFGDIFDAPLLGAWKLMCDKYGVNEWCMNEGTADRDDTILISLKDAEEWGVIENDEY